MFGKGLIVVFYFPSKIVFGLCPLLGVVHEHRHALIALVFDKHVCQIHTPWK